MEKNKELAWPYGDKHDYHVCGTCKKDTSYGKITAKRYTDMVCCNECFSAKNPNMNNVILKCPFCSENAVVYYYSSYGKLSSSHVGYVMKCLNPICKPYEHKEGVQ